MGSRGKGSLSPMPVVLFRDIYICWFALFIKVFILLLHLLVTFAPIPA